MKLATLGLMPLLFACQAHQREQALWTPHSFTPYTTTRGYALADPDCTKEKALTDLGTVSVWVWNTTWPEKVHFNLSGISGALQSRALAGGVIKAVYSRANQAYQEENPGEPLYLCRPGGDYPHDSLENIALGAMVSIKQVFDQLERNPIRALPRVSLFIHPQVTSDDPKEKGVDNAVYFGNKIFIYPHSEEVLQKIYQGIPLWAQLSVVSHEYGHHLLAALAVQNQTGALLNRREMLPIEESFADLVSYYAWGGKTDGIGKLRFGDAIYNRDVATCQCDDGSFKVLNNNYLSSYFASLALLGGAPNPTDCHSLGAIIAFGLEGLIARYDSQLSWDHKFTALLRWGRSMTSRLTVQYAGEEQLLQATGQGVRVIRQSFGTFSELACQHLKTTFPLYYHRWLSLLPECH